MITQYMTQRDQRLLVGIIFFTLVIPGLLLFAFAAGSNITTAENNQDAQVLGVTTTVEDDNSNNFICVDQLGNTFEPAAPEEANGQIICDCNGAEVCTLYFEPN